LTDPASATTAADGSRSAGTAGATTGGSAATATTSAAVAAGVAGTAAPPGLVVHVAGGVVRPGVYHLPPGSRVDDAIAAAGGPVPGVDVDTVNRAAPLTDGQRIRVPLPGEPPPPEPPPPAATDGVGAGGAGGGAATPASPVNLNTATAEELETLPGVGPAIAAAIIDQRTRTGGFRTVRDLLDVRGIGESRLAQLEPLVTV
jgi:competence protein ComEA